MAVTFYNDVEFKSEDAFVALLVPVQASDLVNAPIVMSLASEVLEVDHIAIIAEEFEAHQDPPRSGNWKGNMRIKVVTAFDQTVPNGFSDLRALHRQRVGVVRDIFSSSTLDADLTTAGQAIDGNTGFTVQGFNFGRITQRIIGRSWVTEWMVVLDSVCGSNL